jgi:hypothetical protein
MLVLVAAPLRAIAAYEVEAESTGNTLYILLRNTHPTSVFSSISLGSTLPPFVSQATVSLTPAPIAASQSDLAALAFDVAAGAALGATGELEVHVAGEAEGKPVTVVLPVSLLVVATAPVAQGVVGEGVPVPAVGGVDTDGDGVTDALEVAFGSDPTAAASVPGAPLAVPALEGVGFLSLGGLLFGGGLWLLFSRWSLARSGG